MDIAHFETSKFNFRHGHFENTTGYSKNSLKKLSLDIAHFEITIVIVMHVMHVKHGNSTF